MARTMVINQQNFKDEVLASGQPVLLDFWAGWCGPCHAVAPVVEKIATDYEGRARVGKVDVDDNQTLAQEYDIRAIPTLLFFKGGEVVDRIIGVPPNSQALTDKLDALL